jgi:hypothetical protein
VDLPPSMAAQKKIIVRVNEEVRIVKNVSSVGAKL